MHGVIKRFSEYWSDGDVVSLHWLTSETLKEKYSFVDGVYSVSLLDLIENK